MAEVYAGFSEYTDSQVGRIIDYLEESGQLDNTLIMYCSDNGASGEGSPNGSVNEGKFFNGYPDEIKENLALADKLGGPETYGHYPTGWAVAFSTPFRMFKRYTYQGGACCPLVISWPKGIRARGEIRDQYHHATDVFKFDHGKLASWKNWSAEVGTETRFGGLCWEEPERSALLLRPLAAVRGYQCQAVSPAQ